MVRKKNKLGAGRPRLTTDNISESVAQLREKWRAAARQRYYGSPEIQQWSKAVLGAARRRAQEKGINFDLTIGEIVELARETQNCPLTGRKLDYERGKGAPWDDSASLDRIDNTGGYTLSNCHIVSHRANTAKGRLTLEEMVRAGDWARERQRAELAAGEDRLAELMAAFFAAIETFENRTQRPDHE